MIIIKRRKQEFNAMLATLLLMQTISLATIVTNAQQQQNQRTNSGRAIKPSTTTAHIDNNLYPLNSTKFPCSTVNENAARVDFCARPLMNLVEGKVDRWPDNLDDVSKNCLIFADSERCVRNTGRRCMKGLQRTIVSTLAGAVSRVRKSECRPVKYDFLLKLSKCSEHNQKQISTLMSNFSQYLTYIEDDAFTKNIDLKTSRICCLAKEMPANMQRTLNPVCPAETPTIIRIYNLLLEEVLALICARTDASKCLNLFNDFKPNVNKKINDNQIITLLIKILFSLGS